MLCETWLNNKNESLCDIEGYKSISVNRENRRGGGVRLYYRNNIQVVKLDELSGIFDTHEALFTRVTISQAFCFNIGCVYRPPSLSLQNFNDYLENTLLTDDNIINNKCIIMGDFNIRLNQLNNIALPYLHTNFLDIMTENNFKQYINTPTHIANDGQAISLLDLAFCNFFRDCRSCVIDEIVTDHYPVLFSFPLKVENQLKNIKFRDFSDENLAKFMNAKEQLFASYNVNSNANANINMHDFIVWLIGIVNTYFPIKTKKLTRKRAMQPWLTANALTFINKKHKLFRLVKNGQYPYCVFKAYCKVLKFYLEQLKKNYYNSKFKNFQRNSKKMWDTINIILGRGKKDNIRTLKKDNGEVISDNGMIAQEFNSFFHSIPHETQSRLKQASSDYTHLVEPNNKSMFMHRIQSEEIVSIINQLDTNKSLSDIPTKFLKLIKFEISQQLSILLNECIKQGVYPDILKIARIVPVHKGGNSQLVNNFRPISILPVLNKIFEKLIYNRLLSFFNDCNILSDNQFGFRKFRDTQQATLKLINYLSPILGSDEIAACVFLDFSKAFDTVDHKILLDKLYRYGVRGLPLKLLHSYLDHRKQYVNIDKKESSHLDCKIGVPQGSVLGPLLFILYTNDLNFLIDTLFMIMFADDTSLVIKSYSADILHMYLTYVLNKILDWCNFNKLSLNKDKTKIMYITNKKIVFRDVYIDGTKIEIVKLYRYLGFLIDDKLTHKHHIDSIIAKLRRFKYISYKIRPFMTIEAAKSFYYGLIFSILCYGTLVWGGTLDTAGFSKLQSLQNSIIFNLFSLPDESKANVNVVYKRQALLQVTDLYKLKAILAVYEVLNNGALSFLYDNLQQQLQNHVYNTRNSQNFRLPFPRSRAIKLNFMYKAILLWNNLPFELRCSPHSKQLNKALKKYYLDSY